VGRDYINPIIYNGSPEVPSSAIVVDSSTFKFVDNESFVSISTTLGGQLNVGDKFGAHFQFKVSVLPVPSLPMFVSLLIVDYVNSTVSNLSFIFSGEQFNIVDTLGSTILVFPNSEFYTSDIFAVTYDGSFLKFYQNTTLIQLLNPIPLSLGSISVSSSIYSEDPVTLTTPATISSVQLYRTYIGPSGPSGPAGEASTVSGPSGPSGPQGNPGTAGGLVLYLNAATETINSNTHYQLDNTLSSSQQTYSATIPGTSTGTLTNRFVITSGNTPAVIPGGLWDLNLWAYDSATAGIQVYFMVKVITNLGGAVSTLLASSDVVNIVGTSLAEYVISGYIPTTAVAIGNRIVVEIYANNTNGTGHNLTYQWGFSTTPSHLHTSISIAIVGEPGATGAGGALGYYGNFFNSVTQTFAANTNTAFLLNGTAEANGVSIDPAIASKIVVANAGTYNFQFSAQVRANNGATNFIIWYRINGTNIPQSATDIRLANNEFDVVAWNFVHTMTAGSWFELIGLAAENPVRVESVPAVTGPPAYPAIPGIILTVTQVMYTQIGPSGPSGVSGVSGPSGVSGVSGPSGVSGVSGPSGVSGVSGPSGVSGVSGPSGPSGAVGPVATSISTSSVTGTSLTAGTSPAISTSTYGTYYYITNSGFNALTLPTTTAGSTVGSYWVLRNNTSTYLSITVTNTANVTNPLVIPPSNSATIVVTTASSSPAYVLF
jgi:hypothetical protein